MQDDINQRISQLIDDDLNTTDTLGLLKMIRSDERFSNKMLRYQAISQSIKSGKFEAVRPDFLKNISNKIQQEPAYLLPTKKSSVSKLKVYATAASVLTVAVLAGQVLWQKQSTDNDKIVTVAANTAHNKPLEHRNTKQLTAKSKPLNAEFNAYLQAHNSSFYTNGEAYFQPDAKVVSFGR